MSRERLDNLIMADVRVGPNESRGRVSFPLSVGAPIQAQAVNAPLDLNRSVESDGEITPGPYRQAPAALFQYRARASRCDGSGDS